MISEHRNHACLCRGLVYNYRPQKDITPYELSNIMLAMVQGMTGAYKPDDFEKWWNATGPDIRRHFHVEPFTHSPSASIPICGGLQGLYRLMDGTVIWTGRVTMSVERGEDNIHVSFHGLPSDLPDPGYLVVLDEQGCVLCGMTSDDRTPLPDDWDVDICSFQVGE